MWPPWCGGGRLGPSRRRCCWSLSWSGRIGLGPSRSRRCRSRRRRGRLRPSGRWGGRGWPWCGWLWPSRSSLARLLRPRLLSSGRVLLRPLLPRGRPLSLRRRLVEVLVEAVRVVNWILHRNSKYSVLFNRSLRFFLKQHNIYSNFGVKSSWTSL